MLKTRTWFRLGAGLVVMLFILWAVIIVWPESPPRPEEIAKRGLKPPPGMKIRKANAGDPSLASIGGPRDWLDQSIDALAGWNGNPFQIQHTEFWEHLSKLKHSKAPKDQEEYRRLVDLAKIWRDNLLTRHPELKVEYRNVPDERNALKRLPELSERLRENNPDWKLPDDLKEQLSNKMPWNPEAARAWLDANRDLLDEFRAVCRMPESSAKDVDCDGIYGGGSVGSKALFLEARLAADRGDMAAAQEAVRTAMQLSDHLVGSEAPSMLEYFMGNNIREQAAYFVIETILPAGQADPAAWESVLNPVVQSPSDFSRLMRGEWNRMMQFELLPALADPAANRAPADAEILAETFTNYFSDAVLTNNTLSLADLPSRPNPVFDASDLSWRSRQITELVVGYPIRNNWERKQIQTGRIQAAFAILKGQPVPNDPIYGQPYSWNPETRQLGMPKGPEFSQMRTRPLTLPKL